VLDRAGSQAELEAALAKKPHLQRHRAAIIYHRGLFSHRASSSAVRRAVVKSLPLDGLVSAAVARYIAAQGLYR